MALYGPAVKKLIPPGPTDPRIKPRIVILHVDAGNASSLYDWFNGPSGGVESHFFVKKDGTVEQYRDTGWQADANTDANDWAISIETQGFEAGEWTPEQLASIKALILWCHKTHDIPLQRCSAWDGAGVGYHTLFPGRWDKRGASCPGPDRKLQFNQVLDPWMRAGGNEDVVTPEDIDKVADAVVKKLLGADVIPAPFPNKSNPTFGVGSALEWTLRRSSQTRSEVAALRAGMTAMAKSLPADVAKQVTDALDADYDAQITLTPKEPS